MGEGDFNFSVCMQISKTHTKFFVRRICHLMLPHRIRLFLPVPILTGFPAAMVRPTSILVRLITADNIYVRCPSDVIFWGLCTL